MLGGRPVRWEQFEHVTSVRVLLKVLRMHCNPELLLLLVMLLTRKYEKDPAPHPMALETKDSTLRPREQARFQQMASMLHRLCKEIKGAWAHSKYGPWEFSDERQVYY